MDKSNHLKTLVEVLTELDQVFVLNEGSAWKGIKKAGQHCEPVLDTKAKAVFGPFTSDSKVNTAVKKNLKQTSANYFVGRTVAAGEDAFLFEGNAYRVIGEAEKRILRKQFYKDVPFEIREAMDALRIPHFIDLFEEYNCTENASSFIEDLDFLKQIKQEYEHHVETESMPEAEIGDIVYHHMSHPKKCCNSSGLEGVFIKVTSIGEYVKGQAYADPWGMEKVKTSDKDHYISSCFPLKSSNTNMALYAQWNVLDEFFEFVFSLPDEEKNVEVDCEFLSSVENLPIKRIMLSAYEDDEPELFQAYFDILSEAKKESVVKMITSLPEKEQNIHLNHHMLEKGYQGPSVDSLKLQAQNPGLFLTYFAGLDEDEQTTFLQKLYETPDVDMGVMKELSNQYPALVEEIGMHHVTKEGS